MVLPKLPKLWARYCLGSLIPEITYKLIKHLHEIIVIVPCNGSDFELFAKFNLAFVDWNVGTSSTSIKWSSGKVLSSLGISKKHINAWNFFFSNKMIKSNL